MAVSDGQTQACESIQQQSRATCCRVDVSQESYTWQDDDGGWHVGRRIGCIDTVDKCLMVDSLGVHWCVHESLLTPYGPRCEWCGGSGKVALTMSTGFLEVDNSGIEAMCPACGGSGRKHE